MDREHMRLVLAARLSRKPKKDKDGNIVDEGIGMETQDHRGKDWGERNGHTIVAVAADTKKGTVAPWDRPKLKPWVTEPELMATYDGILAYKNDRLSRGCWADEARIRLWAEEHGKVLVIVDGPQWPPRHDGDRWAWEAMAIQARKEWEDIRERSMRALGELRERGKLTGRAPWGVVVVGTKYDKTIVPTDECRLYIPQIFERCIKGQSLRTIAAWLDSEGVKPTCGGRWNEACVRDIIRNRTYAGRKLDGQGQTILTCEDVVDAAIFDRANKTLKHRPKRGSVGKQPSMLAALRCARCEDSPMYRIWCGSAYYYRCAGRGAQRKGCGNMVRLDRLDNMVAARMLAWHDEPYRVGALIPGTNWDAEIADTVQSIRELDPLADDYDTRLAELRATLTDYKNREAVPDRWEYEDTGKTIGEHFYDLDPEGRRSFLKARDIRAEKTSDGIRVVIDGREDIARFSQSSSLSIVAA